MRKVLIISHFWPYRGGSKRAIGLAKYLPKFGWEPIILTGPLWRRPEPGLRVIETDYKGLFGFSVKLFGINPRMDLGEQLKNKVKRKSRKMKSFLRFFYNSIREIIAYPDDNRYWKEPAIKKASEIIDNEKIEAIISIWPVTSHIIAKELKEKYKIPWIADFPDLWSQNHNYSYGYIRRFFDRKLEKETISLTDALVTTSKPWAENLEALHKEKKVYTITHGFDPKKINIPPIPLASKFTITYTGQIYTGKQDPSKILIAIRNLITDRIINADSIELRFYGSINDFLREEIKKYELSNVAKQYGEIFHEDSLKKQRDSQLLLLLNWEDKKEKGVYTGKIFEYLGARRPILVTGGYGDDVVQELLFTTKAGVYAPTKENIKNHLKKFYLEYKKEGKVDFWGDLKEINKYSHLEMAKKFADILEKTI